MKRIFIYICLAGLIGIMSSCVNDFRLSETPGDGEGVTLTISLSMPEMQTMQTRGVLDENTMLNPHVPTTDYLKSLKLYMFIFENTGAPESNYLLTLVHGDRIGVTATEEEEADGRHAGHILQTFTANVEGTSEKAIVHLVATADPNFEEQLQEATDRTELGLFYGSNGLYTRDQYPAFWKRIDLGMPINEKNAETEEFKEKLSHVQMIRNFCQVTVGVAEDCKSPDNDKFVIDGYALVNQVNAAYVAAYSDNEPRRGFVEFEASGDDGKLNGTMKTYGDMLTKDKYIPARHPASVRDHKEEKTSEWLPAEGQDDSGIFSPEAKYMFERPYQSQHHTFVIIKGHFVGTPADHRYIKLDIGDIPEWLFDKEKGFYLSSAFEYRHLYRNFSYNINITTIASKNVGSATAAGAISGPAVNNVGATVETQSITDISDGVDRMFVNETKFVIVDDDNGDPFPASFELMWRYVSDWQHSKVNDTQHINCDYPGMELVSNDDSGIFADVKEIAYNTTWPEGWTFDDLGGWSGRKITFEKPDETVRQKTVRLYYSNPSTSRPNVRLSRDITFVMRKRWEFVTDNVYPSNIEVYPGAYSYENNTMPYESLAEMRANIDPGYVGSQRGAQLTVMFELPGDLPESLFPLDFKIGFDRQNVENAYVGNAIVTTGPSMFEDDPGGVGVMRMQFIKTVTWDYYHGSGDAGDKGHKIVTARFVTTNDVLNESGFVGDEATTRVRVTNPYFTRGADDFKRAAHEDVIDPTRTHWYWNFSYPEWATYFDPSKGYVDCTSDPIGWPNWITDETQTDNNPHTLNDLHFAGYTHASSNGTYMQIRSDLNGINRSATNPELWFETQINYADYNSGKVTITATPHRARSGNSSRNYVWYDRDVYVGVITNNNILYSSYKNCNQSDEKLPINDLQYSLDSFKDEYGSTLPNDATINKVIIWSVKKNSTATMNPGETRYYSIELTLTPKPTE